MDMEVVTADYPDLVVELGEVFDSVMIARTGLRQTDFMPDHPITQGCWAGHEVDRGELISVVVNRGERSFAQTFLRDDLIAPGLVLGCFREQLAIQKERAS